MTAWYNEIDPLAAQMLRNLIAAGELPAGYVDERSITDVRPEDLDGFTQCHFFAGIGGWPLAARLAGWPDDRPIWTGSCPCQPFSIANAVWKRGKGTSDERHLWPFWYDLIVAKQPRVVFGEQVKEAIAGGWFDEVADDMERSGFAVWAAVIAALGVGSPQERERLWLVCDADPDGWQGLGELPPNTRAHEGIAAWGETARTGGSYRGKGWLTKPGISLLADGLPPPMVKGAAHGFGNAIVPQVGAEIIGAYLEGRPNG